MCFLGCLLPFQRLSDLQLGDHKVTLNSLVGGSMSFLARGFLQTSIHLLLLLGGPAPEEYYPIPSMYGIFTYIWLKCIVINPYKWPHRWANGVVTLVITARGPRVINIY